MWKLGFLAFLVVLWSALNADYVIQKGDGLFKYERRGVDIPNDAYPSVLLVIDYNLKQKINKPNSDIISYYRRFYGMIQRIYNSMEIPRFNFTLSDVYICESLDDCSYIKKHMKSGKLEATSEFLAEEGEWAKSRASELPPHDILMSLTSLDMCGEVHSNGSCTYGLAGKAYLRGACTHAPVGVAVDDGGYGGVKVTAHEMAHLFGAVHDGDNDGGEDCSGWDSYIMGGGPNKENFFRLSPCTIRSIADFVSSSRGKCLRQKSGGKYSVDMILPGASKSLEEQCQDKYGPESIICPFMPNQDPCDTHFCSHPPTGTCRSSGAALTGTPCDQTDLSKVCFMSYGCVNKSFKPPTVKVDLTSVAKRTTIAPPAGGCIDEKSHAISVTNDGKSTGCVEQFQLYPEKFCETTWAHSICCATAYANCEANGDVKPGRLPVSSTPSDEETQPPRRTTPIQPATTPFIVRTTPKPLTTTPRPTRTTSSVKFCIDEPFHHLKVVINEAEKPTDCPTQFNRHPNEFCQLDWVAGVCCKTSQDNCINGKPKHLPDTVAPTCQDRPNMHLQVTTDGVMQDCAGNYRDRPEIFCKLSWVSQYCCGTHAANCH